MVSIYKDLIDAVNKMEDISVAIEKDHDPSLIPELRMEKLVLKYVADQVLKMENQIIILNQQVKKEWIRDTQHIISDALMGYDEGEPEGSPYGITIIPCIFVVTSRKTKHICMDKQ